MNFNVLEVNKEQADAGGVLDLRMFIIQATVFWGCSQMVFSTLPEQHLVVGDHNYEWMCGYWQKMVQKDWILVSFKLSIVLSHSAMSDSLQPYGQTVASQAPLSMGFSQQDYWSELPFPLPGNLPDPGIKPVSPALQMDSLLLSHWGSPFKYYLNSFHMKRTYSPIIGHQLMLKVVCEENPGTHYLEVRGSSLSQILLPLVGGKGTPWACWDQTRRLAIRNKYMCLLDSLTYTLSNINTQFFTFVENERRNSFLTFWNK